MLSGNTIGTDAASLTASKVVITLINLISFMLLSRFCTLNEYGTYSQLLMSVNLVSTLMMLGFPNSVNYFLAKASCATERDAFLSVYYTFSSILSFFIGLVLVLSIPILENFFENPAIKFFWYFLAFYPWTRIIMSSIENFLIVYHKISTLILYRILNSITLLLVIIIFEYFYGTFNQYMLSFLCIEIIFTLWIYKIIKQNSRHLTFSLNNELIRKIFSFSLPIGLASMIGTLNIELDKIFVALFFSTEDLAIYTNASKEIPVTIIPISFTAVLIPQFVKLLQSNQKERVIALWHSATSISFAIISVISFCCFIFAPEVITILYSEKYLGGITVFRIYCIVLLGKCAYMGIILNATGNTKMIMYSSFGTLILNIVLNYLCYILFGFSGIAIATLIATISMQMFQIIYSSRIIDIKFTKIFPWNNCGRYLLLNIFLGIIFGLVIYCVKMYVNINLIVAAVMLGILWVTIFFVLTYKQLKEHWRFLNA